MMTKSEILEALARLTDKQQLVNNRHVGESYKISEKRKELLRELSKIEGAEAMEPINVDGPDTNFEITA